MSLPLCGLLRFSKVLKSERYVNGLTLRSLRGSAALELQWKTISQQ